ncbi:MAG: radical SAM protein [Sedimentisphaerales bacterium]|nr:radical SAM protein [Sedimentisphaerales bacterium]
MKTNLSQNSLTDRVASRLLERKLPRPVHVDLMLTDGCNHRCEYCFVKDKHDGQHMSLDVARDAVDFMFHHSRNSKMVSFLFFGGEPLLNWDCLVEVVSHAQELAKQSDKQPSFGMTTNGTLFNLQRLKYLKENNIKYLLSIDGDKNTHDLYRPMQNGDSSYETVMRMMQVMKTYQLWQGTRMTVHPDCADRIHDNIVHLHQKGINQFLVGPATGIDWSSKQLTSYEEQMYQVIDLYAEMQKNKAPFRMSLFEDDLLSEKGKYKNVWGCGAGRGRICIATDGSLYGCAKILGAFNEHEKTKLGDIWSGYSLPLNRWDLLDNSVKRREQCRNCDIADECCGGCPATNYEENRTCLIPSKLDCAFAHIAVRLKERARILLAKDAPADCSTSAID